MGHNGRCGTHPRRYAAREGERLLLLAVAYLIPSPAHRWPVRHALGGRGQGEVGSMICAQHQKHFPWLHRADTCAPASRQVSALFSPQPGADASVCFGCNRYRIRFR